MSASDFQRLEDKVDTLTEAVTRLVLFEERQTVQAETLKSLDERTSRNEQKLDAWINRGIGVWAVVAVAISIYKALHP